MNGFDKWTSRITSESMADIISLLPCSVVADYCPLYIECLMVPNPDGIKLSTETVRKCREKLCEYFDKEIEE